VTSARSTSARLASVWSAWRARLFAGLCLLGVIGLIGLGVWQIERRTWKLALIGRVAQRVHALPRAIPAPASWLAVNAAKDEYRHVTVTGRFMHDREALVQAVTEEGRGFWLVTPMRVADGTIVLVNRGFVPAEWRDPAKRGKGDPQLMVTVTGLLRMTEPKGAFLRTNDPAGDRWYSRDVAAIAAARGLAQVAPFFIDEDATPDRSGYPIGGLTVIAFANNHLMYALTWFALAFMLAGAYLRIVRGAHISSGEAPSDAEACTHSA
jgi:surfeit locus 1 family protein